MSPPGRDGGTTVGEWQWHDCGHGLGVLNIPERRTEEEIGWCLRVYQAESELGKMN